MTRWPTDSHRTRGEPGRMKRLKLTSLVLLALAVLAFPAASTAGEKTAVGPNFNMFGQQTDLAAGTAFHILLGWEGLSPDLDAIGHFSWTLDVDGTPRAADFHFFGPSPIQDDALARAWYFNFPNGMSAGTHTFVAHGFAPCYSAVSSFVYTGTCSNPNAVVESATFTM